MNWEYHAIPCGVILYCHCHFSMIQQDSCNSSHVHSNINQNRLIFVLQLELYGVIYSSESLRKG